MRRKISKNAKIGIACAVTIPVLAATGVVIAQIIKTANLDPNREICIPERYFNISPSGELLGLKDGVDLSRYNTIKIPSKCTSVAAGAFENVFNSATNINKIVIPSTCLSIGENAFAGCTNISKVDASQANPNLQLGYDTQNDEGIFGKKTDIETNGWYCNVVRPANDPETGGIKEKLIDNGTPEYWFGKISTGNATVNTPKEQTNTTGKTGNTFTIAQPKTGENIKYVAVASRTGGTPNVGVDFEEPVVSADGKTVTVNVEMTSDAGHTIDTNDYVEYKITLYCENTTTGESWLEEFTGFKITIHIVHVTGVNMKQSNVTIYMGNYYRLNASVEPANASWPDLTWESSNTDKVEVINGVLIPKTTTAENEITITAKSVEKPEFSASCTITVKNWETDGYPVVALHNASQTEPTTFKVPNVKCWDGTIEYCTNYDVPVKATEADSAMPEVTYTNLNKKLGQSITIEPGKYIVLRGTGNHILSAAYNEQYQGYDSHPWTFVGGELSIKGNILDLFNYNNHANAQPYSYACYGLFRGSNIVSVSQNFLNGISTMVPYAYWGMFANCKSLVSAPELPATVLASGCYTEMFDGCENLVWAPDLNATRRLKLNPDYTIGVEDGMSYYCYRSMFRNCKSLLNAPKLDSPKLGFSCYEMMFKGCSSLEEAPELPATELTNGCYLEMFMGCSKLKITTDSTKGQTKIFTCPSYSSTIYSPVLRMFDNTYNFETLTPKTGDSYYIEKTE